MFSHGDTSFVNITLESSYGETAVSRSEGARLVGCAPFIVAHKCFRWTLYGNRTWRDRGENRREFSSALESE